MQESWGFGLEYKYKWTELNFPDDLGIVRFVYEIKS